MAPVLSMKALALLAVALPFVSAIEVAVPSSDATCWQYKGCYNETDTIHPLQFKILPSLTDDTNNENCQSACLAAGYLMSGTADAYNCWCDNTLNARSNKIAESYCNVPCNTVTSETCGGYSAVSVYDDTCLASPPAPSKTIIITVVPQPTPTNVHTIYTTVIVTGPVNPQPSTRTSVIYVQAPSTTNPYSSSRAPPYRYSRTSDVAAASTCSDILCCLLSSSTCDYTQFINGDGGANGISLILGATDAPKPRRDDSWPTQTSDTYSTSTITSTSTLTVIDCTSTATATIETISTSTTVCPESESSAAAASSSAILGFSAPASASSAPASVMLGGVGTSSSGGYIALTGSLTTSTSAPSIGSGSGNKTSTATAKASPSQVVKGAAEKLGVGLGFAVGMVGILVAL